MGFCDPSEIGRDYCEPNANHTDDHIECATGWMDEASFGGLDAEGCGIGCASCLDYPSEMALHADRRDGTRWLRPTGSTRDGMGRRHDLKTDEPWPMPDGSSYEAGSCYHNTTEVQCFNRSICDQRCWHGGLEDIFSGDDTPCAGGIPVGAPVPSWFPDVFQFSGDYWPPSIYCRKFQDPNSHPTGLGGHRVARLLGPGFPRFGQIPYAYGINHWACQPNALVPCTDQVRTSSCRSGWTQDPTFPPGVLHWNMGSAARAIWDEVRLDATELEIGTRPSTPRPVAAAVAIRSAALQHAASVAFPGGPNGIRFDRLDRYQTGVGLWVRNFNTGCDCAVLADESTRVATFPKCRRTADGGPVTIDLHVLSVEAALYLILWRLRRYHVSSPTTMHIEPHARLLLSVRLAWRSASPEIPNPEDCREIPAGVEFVDNAGRPFRPPRLAEWFGYHGRLGIGGCNEYGGAEGTVEFMCQRAAAGLGELPIPGWPNRVSIEDPPAAWPYVGTARIWFPV